MPPAVADAALPETLPATGPHLLDATAFWNPSGGVHRVISTKRDWLRAHGWRHTLLAPGVHGPHEIDCGGFALPGTGGYRWVLASGPPARLIERARPDIVEAADPYTLARSVLAATERLNLPAVAFCHSDLPLAAARLVGGPRGLDTPHGRWAARRARRHLVRLYAHFDLVLAPSQGMARRLRAWGVQRVVVQPLGVDGRVFNPRCHDPAFRARLCNRLGLAPRTRLLVYSGRFAPEKNLPLLVEAVRLLGPGHALLAVGSGPMPPRGPGVHVLAPEHDSAHLARLLASADVYVHAGDQETFGLGTLEAMACGTPVVVSASGGLGELVHEVGITVASHRAPEWAEAITAALEDASGMQVALALSRARERDWRVVLPQLARRYETLLRGHTRPLTAPASLPASLPAELPPLAGSMARVPPLR